MPKETNDLDGQDKTNKWDRLAWADYQDGLDQAQNQDGLSCFDPSFMRIWLGLTTETDWAGLWPRRTR